MKKNERLMDAIGDISKEFINEASPKNIRVVHYRKKKPAAFIAAAACAALLLAIPVTNAIRSHHSQFNSSAQHSAENAAEIIRPDKAGYELGWKYSYSGDINAAASGEEYKTVAENFGYLFRSYEDMIKPSDIYFYNGILCTVSESQMSVTLTNDDVTYVMDRSLYSNSRIIGADTENNFYVVCTNNDGKTELHKVSSTERTLSSVICDNNILLNECIGFDSISADGSGRNLTLSYSSDGTEGTVNISEETDRIIMEITQGSKKQLISFNADGAVSESDDNIFSFDKSKNIFVSDSGNQKISLAADLAERDIQARCIAVNSYKIVDEIDKNGPGLQYEMTLEYYHIDHSLVSHGSVMESVILDGESALNEGMSEEQTEKINSVLQSVTSDSDGGVVYVGGNEEKGYIMLPDPEMNMRFYSFDMNGEKAELTGTVPLPVTDALFEDLEEFRLGDSMYYNGICYGTAEFVKTDGSIERIVCTCDENGKPGYATVSFDNTSEDDILCIGDGHAGFLRSDGCFFKAEFVYAE